MPQAIEGTSRPEGHTPATLHIFVNRRRFETGDGVMERMTGAQIAALVDVPADNAVVRIENGPNAGEIGVGDSVEVRNGEHYLVTRKVVEGGYEPRTD